MDHFNYRNGRLWCEDVAAEEVASRFGTPTYVYSRATLLGHYDRIAQAFADLDPLICYSVKSCGNLGVLRTLVERGAGMDVVSGGELERAFLAGCPMEKVVYAGVGKTDAEIRAALDGGESLLGRHGGTEARRHEGKDPAGRGAIGWFNIESEAEFENVARFAREMGVRAHGALRVNPDVDPKTHAYTTTGKKESKFGVDLERALAFFEKYGREEFLKLDAVHIHLGSPIYTVEPYVQGITKVLGLIDELARRGFAINAIDLGGGFGADYETDKSPAAADYAAAIVPLLRGYARCGRKIILEPGRTISANAGVLLTRVLYVKQGGTKTFVITDAGMQTLIRPSLYGSFHFMWPAEVRPEHVPQRRAEKMEMPGLVACDVVGPICETGDFLAKDRAIPPVKRGDLLAVFTAGAYGMTMASNYNAQPLPAEVLVDGTEARVVRRRQTVAEMVGLEE
jgi:diaminopimelate decarboxylase